MWRLWRGSSDNDGREVREGGETRGMTRPGLAVDEEKKEG